MSRSRCLVRKGWLGGCYQESRLAFESINTILFRCPMEDSAIELPLVGELAIQIRLWNKNNIKSWLCCNKLHNFIAAILLDSSHLSVSCHCDILSKVFSFTIAIRPSCLCDFVGIEMYICGLRLQNIMSCNICIKTATYFSNLDRWSTC